jgi:tetratricopeptide (TPR) repeat protein
VGEAACDPLEAGLAAAFGPDSGPPLPVTGSVVQALGAAPVQLREPDTEPADPVVRPHSDAVSAEAPARLQLQGEIARGGMGAVLKGRDVDLGRDVAVKVLLEAHAGRTELVQRFVEEAQVAGQLQHPGVVPVYQMGQLPDRRPYFTMKLVKGQTLAQLLARRTDPAQDRPRLLKVFEQVCQALAYAHARGVIHRDLKPSNVMVGAFGEVQVMDWGLAKILRQGGADEKAPATAEATVIRTARGGSATPPPPGSQTQAGAVLGTPAYMAPEQARGETARLDERCDVFGLGAILCTILTGQPPYAGADGEAVYGLASRAELAGAFARLDGCGADAELIALVKCCLCADPAGRPRDAGALAAELNAYLGSVEARLRRAELDRAAAEARAVEERKRRRVALALAAAVLALVAVGAGGGLLVQHQAAERRAELARREAEQRQQVEAALDKAATLRQQAHWGEAAAVLDQARQALGDAGPGDLRHRLDVADAELALVNRLDAIRQRRAITVEGHFDYQTAEKDYAAAFREAGLGKVGDDGEAVAARVRASPVAGPLVAALDDWAWVARKKPESRAWLLGVAQRADPDPWRARFRDPAVWQDQQALQALADEALRDDQARLGELSPQGLASLAMLLRGHNDKAVLLLRAAQGRCPNDFWLNLALGNALGIAEQHEEALGYYRVAVALRPDAAGAHSNLGGALREKGDLDGAIAEFREAIRLDPKLAHAHSNLGIALHDKKDLEGAIAAHKKAIELAPNHAIAHNNLGNALYAKKDLDGAIAAYHKAIDLDPKYVLAHSNLGSALAAKGDRDGAIAEYKKAIDLDPKYAPAHNNLGVALGDKKDLDGAIAEHKKAIELDPKVAHAHYNLGNALRHKGDPDGAIAAYHKAIDLDPKDAAAHTNLGLALRDKGDLDGAIAACREAIRLDPKVALVHYHLGFPLYDKGDLNGAIAAYRTAIELDPKDALAHYQLGLALYDKKDLEGAIAEYRKAIELDPDYPEAHCNLGGALRAQRRFADALREFRRGHELGSRRPGWPYPSADWVRQCERLLAVDEQLPALLAGQAEPADASDRIALARICQRHKALHAAAAHFYADAFAIDPRLAVDLQPQYHQPEHGYDAACSATLAAAGQGEDARHLPDKARLMLRRQALAWLRDDLAAYTKFAERPEPAARQAVRQRLTHWRQDADLASVRDPQALGQLPEDERRQWHQLWEEVATLLKKVEQKP